ncbi:HdeD family acid-resistance protein [Vagococcus jeotgali]|uniref:HdeD family acid-resistance protein n=1 Tax=Vagococcus jeotgali TaxID=3109030 RepID=UPI002DDB4CF9|nr:DUF308 domain-containing protein [Vagococcus sp. B2T-5]
MIQRKSIKRLSTMLGIIYIIVAVLSFFNPWSDLKNVMLLFGAAAILKGIFELFFRNKLRGYNGVLAKVSLGIGVFDVLVGIILLFSLVDKFLALPVVFAIWFIVDSIVGLLLAEELKSSSTLYYWLVMIVSIVGVLIGAMLVFNPMLSVTSFIYLISTYLLINGISECGSMWYS